MGKLIVLEGLDGSGKSTQTELLTDFLKAQAVDFRKIKLPDYDSPSSTLVKMYLSGDFGKDADNVNAYAAGAFYAVDRKLDQSEWNAYLSWSADFEYQKLGIPKPDLVLFLDMPVEISQRLMSERYGGDESEKDVHENNVSFLEKCRDAALYAAEKEGWKIISCSDGNQPLPMELIHSQIKDFIKEVLC